MSTKEDVVAVQKALIARGYDLGKAGADGDAGPLTIKAVMSFQKSVGLHPDGIVGRLTKTQIFGAQVSAHRADPAMPPWLALAAAEIGTHEGVGKANNPKVVAYFKDAGFPSIKDDATAWCAAFVGAMLRRAGEKPSGSLAARSYEAWGVGLKAPILGCIATKKRAGSAWLGHVFFVVGADATHVYGLGGNQTDAVNIATFKRSEITSFRWPDDVPIPTDTKLPTTVAGAKAATSEA